MITEAEVAWVAGLLEGEGCFDFYDNKTKRWPRIRMTSTDKDTLEKLHKLVGGTLRSEKRRTEKPHWKPIWIWRLHKREKVKNLLALIYPWLSVRRKQKVSKQLLVLK